MSKCSRVKECLGMHPEGLTVKEIAKEVSLPEDCVLFVVESDHPDDFESSTNLLNGEIVYQIKA